MHGGIDDVICTCLSRVYSVHMVKTDRLTCTLEHHALPIRHTFFRLKRVPHFQSRDDLHDDRNPAYNPIYRLENASLESLSQKSRAGCRRVLLEGDLGTGKTLVCHRLLHEWAKAMQFFRNVKVENPYITVDSNNEDNHGKSEKSRGKHIVFQDQIQSSKTGDENQNSKKSEDSHGKSKVVEGGDCDSSGCGNSGHQNTEDPERSKSCEWRKDCKENSEDKTGNCENHQDENTSPSHQSRRTLFDKKNEKMNNRDRSRSNKANRKGSRSRSASETERESKNRRRSKDKHICDGIPQKYLSLLNIPSPGEGSFESPNVSRARTFREPRRQRLSRLTSNLKDYKAMIYLPCVRLALSELLAKCNNPRVRHYYLAASVLLDLLSFSDVLHKPLPFDAVYHWVLANRDDICIIFDNVDASTAWERLIADAFHDNDGFGKIIVASTPGRISKRDVDSLFYCYGLSSEYSNKIITNRLKSEAPNVNDRIQFLLSSSHTQELLCNPLSLSLLSAYFRSLKEKDEIPDHLSELLEYLIEHAMAHEVSLKSKINGKRRTFSLQSVCETLAFECLENGTNYFSKQKFPFQFWTRHLCDCRVLHEVHEIANFGPIHERAVSPVTNYSLTPDSDSVHSSNSSILDPYNFSDFSSSNQSLASNEADKDGTKNENESMEKQSSPKINDTVTSSGPLLQVPVIHTPSDQTKKTSERPKTLSLDTKRSQTKLAANQNQNNGDIVSFTSRCIRDFLASKRVCRYLQSDRDCEAFIQRLISKPEFYPVLRLTVRSLYISERSDVILDLMDMLLTTQELNFGVAFQPPSLGSSRGSSPINAPEPQMKGRIRHRYRVSNSDCPFRAKREEQKQRRSSTSVLGTCFEGDRQELTTSSSFNKLLLNSSSLSPYTITVPEATRGYLEDFKEALIWLAETDNSEPYISAIANRFPDTLVISYQECPSETIEHFVCLVKRSSPVVKEIVLYMSGFYTQWDLGLKLAEAIQELQRITMVTINMKCVIETSFLVDFICECLDNNKHIGTLRLEGPMNVAENLTQEDHKRIDKIFNQNQSTLKTLIVDHFSYHHRVGYILNCWPNVLKSIHLKKCNLDNVADKINLKLSGSSPLEHLSIENCYVPTNTLMSILKHIRDNSQIIKLARIDLSLLSSSRRFAKTDVKRCFFKSSITHDVCEALSDISRNLPSLKDLVLTNNGISSDKARILFKAAVCSSTLASLDLTGNVIGDDVEEDVIYLMNQSKQLASLLLGDNNITKDVRSAIIKESLRRHDLRLSL